MSDSIASGGDDKGQNASGSNQGEEFVSKKAYEEVSRDMHRYKQTAKEAAAAKSEYEAKLKALEEEKLREANQYKELYEREKQEREALAKKAQDERSAYITAVKKSALKSELGGTIKDAYLVHANVSAIELNEDGSINQESLLKVANEFRQNHGELLPTVSSPDPTSIAAPAGQTVSDISKPINQMDPREFRNAVATAPVRLKK